MLKEIDRCSHLYKHKVKNVNNIGDMHKFLFFCFFELGILNILQFIAVFMNACSLFSLQIPAYLFVIRFD